MKLVKPFKAILAVLCLLALATGCDRFDDSVTPDPSLAFRKVYGSFDQQVAADMLPTADGGFVLLSTSNSFNEVTNDRYNQFYLIFTDENGDELRLEGDQQWVFGEANFNSTANTFLRKNEGFLLLGQESSVVGGGDSQAKLFQTASNGNETGSPELNAPAGMINIRTAGIARTGKGRFLIAGTGQTLSGDQDIVLFKIDGSGEPSDFITASIGFDGTNEVATNVVAINDESSEFAVLANTVQEGIPRMAVFLVNEEGQRIGEEIIQDKFLDVSLGGQTEGVDLNTNGQLAADLVYDGVQLTLLGNDIATGRQLVINVLRVGNTLIQGGGVLKPKTANERILPRRLVPVSGGYLVVGAVTGLGAAGSNIYVDRIDALGNSLGGNWPVTFGGDGEDIGAAALQTADGGFAIYGHVAIEGENTLLTLIKTDANGAVQ